MPRPQKYTDDDYQQYIRQQLNSGRLLRELTAGELQQAVGGQYSRCQAMLDAAKAHADEQEQTAQPMPGWFREFVEHVADQTRRTAEAQWLPVGRGIRESIDEATTNFDQRRQEMETQTRSHLAQIEQLEKELEGFSERLETLQAQLSETQRQNARLESDLQHSQATIDSQRSEIEMLRQQLQAAIAEQGRLQGRVETLEQAQQHGGQSG